MILTQSVFMQIWTRFNQILFDFVLDSEKLYFSIMECLLKFYDAPLKEISHCSFETILHDVIFHKVKKKTNKILTESWFHSLIPTLATKPNLPNQTYQTKTNQTKSKLLAKAVDAWVRSAFGNVLSLIFLAEEIFFFCIFITVRWSRNWSGLR